MNASRLIKSLSALSLIATLALPMVAHAKPITDPSTTPARNHFTSPSRAAYYGVKERQFEQIGGAALHRQSVARPTVRRAGDSYAAMKDKQMERILNGE